VTDRLVGIAKNADFGAPSEFRAAQARYERPKIIRHPVSAAARRLSKVSLSSLKSW